LLGGGGGGEGRGFVALKEVVRYVNVQSIGCGLARVRCEVEIDNGWELEISLSYSDTVEPGHLPMKRPLSYEPLLKLKLELALEMNGSIGPKYKTIANGLLTRPGRTPKGLHKFPTTRNGQGATKQESVKR
jgi:hypothetical protein